MNTWIKGYEGLYTISENGIIFSYCIKDKIKKINPTLDKSSGYFRVRLRKDKKWKSYKLSRLLALSFIPNPENKPYVNHKDKNRANDKIENLEWVTASENTFHRHL